MTYRNNLITLLSALAEASYLFLPYILLARLCNANPHQQFSVSGVLIIVIASSLFNILIFLRPQRRVTVIFLNIIFIILSTLLALGYLHFFNTGFSLNILGDPQNLLVSLQAWLLVFLISLIVLRTMVIVSRTINHRDAVKRFEVSIGVFLVTALLSGLLQVELRESFLVIIIGLISNFLAMTLCKQIEHITGKYLLAGTLALTLFVWSILALLSWGQAYLVNISTWIYSNTIPVLGGAFLNFLKWLLTKGKYINNSDSQAPDDAINDDGGLSGLELDVPDVSWLKYLLWFFMGLIILLLVVFLIILFIYLIKYLLKPKDRDTSEAGFNGNLDLLSLLRVKLDNLVLKIRMLLIIYLSKDINLEKIYRYFLQWGEGKNMPRFLHETPYEYSQRLSLKYPQQREGIELITESYVAFKYGNVKQNKETINTLTKYLKHLYFHT